MDRSELDQFEVLLKAPDQEIYVMLQGEVPPSTAYDNSIFAAMKAFCARRDPTWNV